MKLLRLLGPLSAVAALLWVGVTAATSQRGAEGVTCFYVDPDWRGEETGAAQHGTRGEARQ